MVTGTDPDRAGYDEATEQENTWNARLAAALDKRGFHSARFEAHYRAIVQGKKRPRKPDVDFKDGGTHLISGKFGEAKELEAISSAQEYQMLLGPRMPDLAEVFAVVYPNPSRKGEKFRLHVLPTHDRPGEAPFACDTLGELTDRIVDVVQGRIADLKREPLFDEAPRLLLSGATALSDTLKGVPEADLETIFGGHDFFVSVLEHRLRGPKRGDALRMGAAYLFTNQLLFYILLSRAAELGGQAGQSEVFPRIDLEHSADPRTLSRLYFEKVRLINYEPIYGFDVARHLTGDGAKEATRNLVAALQVLAPNLDNSDLVGQLFQTLIPAELRKPLGAHFTNTKAASLLARLAIKGPDVEVLDPACGSGTLLVSAYQRKKALQKGSGDVHAKFLGHDITGMDAMAFSAHLAVVNLASQQLLTETKHVRVATTDSTIRKPGERIPAAQDALPHEFLQSTLEDSFGERSLKRRPRGAIASSRKHEALIDLGRVDLVIMNPPFTYWGNMSKTYRESMKLRFVNERPAYRDLIVRKTSQQIFFFLLAERFLKPRGVVAAVAPLTTFTGRAFQPFTEWFCKNYTIQRMVLGLGRCSFSEDTSLTECLVVAEKKPPLEGHTFRLIGLLSDLGSWKDVDVERVASAAETGQGVPGIATVMEAKQDDLLPGRRTLAGLYLSLLPEYEHARVTLRRILDRAHASTIGRFFELRGAEVHRYVLGSEHLTGPNSYGTQALLACRSKDRAIKNIDRLVVNRWDENQVRLEDRHNGQTYDIPPSDVRPALRRFSFLPSIDATKETDLCIARIGPSVRAIMEGIYGQKDTRKYLANATAASTNWQGSRWTSRVDLGSSRLLSFYRIDLGSPSTTVLATYTEKPTFIAGGGYYYQHLESTREAKFLALWLNSSLTLHRILESMTITRGTYIQFEKFMIEKLPTPAFWDFTDAEWKVVEQTFDTAAHESLTNLIDQLESGHPARVSIDNTMLGLLGVPAGERPATGEAIRKGCLAALRMLQATMTYDQAKDGVESGEASDEQDDEE
jgi:hypothetical protein